MSLVSAFFTVAFAALMLTGCASVPTYSQSSSSTSPPVVYANLEDAVKAAIEALAEKRLGSPTVEGTENGAVVRAELSGVTSVIYNSYGGSGTVTIASTFPGSKRLRISAITRSRVASEPVGAMDALKGYNYNDPKYAREILERMTQLLPQANTEHLRAENDRARIAWEGEEKRKVAAAAAKRAQEEAVESALIADSKRGARHTCANESDCRKAFSLAQIYVSTTSDMKIQIATDTIIETYNPTKAGRMGAKVIKIPGTEQSAEIVLTVSCRECSEDQRRKSLRLMKEFREFIQSHVKSIED